MKDVVSSKLHLSVFLSVDTTEEKMEKVNFEGGYKAADTFLMHDLRLMKRHRSEWFSRRIQRLNCL